MTLIDRIRTSVLQDVAPQRHAPVGAPLADLLRELLPDDSDQDISRITAAAGIILWELAQTDVYNDMTGRRAGMGLALAALDLAHLDLDPPAEQT